MAQEHVGDADVQEWLQSVGVASLCQWEVLTFFHRHRISLLPPQYLARLLGYQLERVVAALDALATLRLLDWSAQRAGQFIVRPVRSRSEALERLLALSHDRSGRLLLGRHFGRGHGTTRDELQAARREFLDDAAAVLATIKRFCERPSATVQ